MTLKSGSMVDQTLPAAEYIDRPYPPSWLDRLTDWVDRLPAPAWVFYQCLWLLLIIIESGGKWLDGVEPFVKVRWIYVLYSFYGVYFLAAIHFTWIPGPKLPFYPDCRVFAHHSLDHPTVIGALGSL